MSNSQLSGREQARARRQAQKQGKSALASTPRPAQSTATTAARAPVRRPVSTAGAPASAAGRDAARQRREQQKSGKTSRVQGTVNPHPKAKAKLDREPVVQPRAQEERKSAPAARPANARKVNVNNQPVKQSSGRNVAKAWRKAGAKGKTGQSVMKTNGTTSGSIAKMSNPGASTREIARKVRAERCTKGKSGCKPTETASAKRARASKDRSSSPSKVGESNTLSGQRVSGTQVGQGRKVMTGAEMGACKIVSGTEYLGQEEFVSHCNTQPDAAPAKVSQSQTTRGQVVSGNEVGNSESVTGDQAGQCSAVTGTEYIPADQSAIFCGADAPVKAAMAGFSVMSEPSNAGRSKFTGGENYKSQSTTIRPENTPQKVVMSATAMGNMTSGTQVGRVQDVTGSETGQCKSVTGTGYQSPEESQAFCGTDAAPTANKVTTSGTSRGQIVTGDRSGGNFDLTGAEAGTCQAVTGTAYAGVENASACPTDRVNAIQQRVPSGINPSISGVQPGPVGLTGAQKGACSLVSGTYYQGTDQTAMVCDSSNTALPGQSDFPIVMGQQPVVNPVAQPVQEAPQASSITGDAWDRGTKVTGTEGPWASQRNASFRGVAGQAPMGASQFRPVAMEEVPQSPITGSSGNTDTGAKVTLSGGARAQ